MELDLSTAAMAAGAGILAALVAGKTIRRIILLPFEWLASKTESRIDDKIVEQAEEDLGIPGGTLPNSKKEEKKNDE